MLSLIRNRLSSALIAARPEFVLGSAVRSYSHKQETDADFDSKWESYFKK